MIWVNTMLSVALVSVVSLIGVSILSLGEQHLEQMVFVMVSLAVGAMFGDTFFHLLPEAFAAPDANPRVPLTVLAGLLAFFLLEKFLLWRHEHVPHYGECIQPIGYVNVVAEGFHNFIDGLLIGASYLVSLQIGFGTTLAVLLHEIPHEMGNFGVLRHAGFSQTRALSLNFLSASLAIVGAVAALVEIGRAHV